MLQFCLLGSGSSGNAILVSSGETRILIDNGLSYKQLCLRADRAGMSLAGLKALFITHEHGDHVKGAGILARKTGVPVYLTEGTHAALSPNVGEIPRAVCFEAGDTLQVDGLTVESFSVSHDAADPVSYTVRHGAAQVGLATDLGHVSHLVRTRLAGSTALILEANYCPEMLRRGHYPPRVQQRIRSRSGHLSNQDMTSLLDDLLHERLRTVVLVHISEHNNTPDLAHRYAARVLGRHGAALHVAAQDEPSPVFEVPVA